MSPRLLGRFGEPGVRPELVTGDRYTPRHIPLETAIWAQCPTAEGLPCRMQSSHELCSMLMIEGVSRWGSSAFDPCKSLPRQRVTGA